MSFVRIIRRFVLDVGIALAVLVVFAIAIILSHGARVPSAWFAFAVYTSLLFWVTIRQSREYWQHGKFWLAIVSLFLFHFLAFFPILRSYPEFRGIWFMPIVICEAGFFGAMIYLLFGRSKSSGL